MYFRNRISRFMLIWIVAMLSWSTNILAAGETSFKKGLEAYRQGQYQRAINLFETARKQGLRKVAVYYNLGSSYYRLGQYDKAIPMFKRVTRYNKMADVGHFNLGLIARQQEKEELARVHFNQAIASSKNEKLIYLARQNLEEIDSHVGVWSGSAGAEFGYDDNVSNTALGVASGGDSYFTLHANAGAVLSGTRRDGWSARTSFYNRSYSSFSSYSLGSISGSLQRNMRLFGQRGYVGGSYKILTLGGSTYENILGLDIRAHTPVRSGVSYRYRYRFDSIDTAPVYSYLQGSRQRIDAERRSGAGSGRLRLAYRLELNNRQNSTSASYTNVRHGIRATYSVKAGPKTRWRTQLRYRVSDYTPVATQNRDDSMLQLNVQRVQKIDKDLEWNARYSLTNNSSTDAAYTYTSNVLQVGIRKRF